MIAFKSDGVAYSIFATKSEVTVTVSIKNKSIKITDKTFKGALESAKNAAKELAPTR